MDGISLKLTATTCRLLYCSGVSVAPPTHHRAPLPFSRRETQGGGANGPVVVQFV